MVYENKRNGKKATLIRSDKEIATLRYEDGTVGSVTISTFKRWWRKVEEEVQTETEAIDIPKKKVKTEKKAKTPNPDIEELKNYIFSEVTKMDAEIFTPAKDIKMRSFKIGGHMFMKMNYSNKSVTLAVRGKCLTEDISLPDRNINHMFDAVYIFTENNSVNKKLISDLLKISMNHQIYKNNSKKEEKKNGKIQSR